MKEAWNNYFRDLKINGKNLYIVELRRFAVVYLLFSATRILFYLFNASYFPEITFSGFLTILAGGLKFDTTAIIYTNLLYLPLAFFPFYFRYNKGFRSFLKYLFIVTNGLALGANCADFIYYQFTLRRTTATVFKEFQNETNMLSLFGKFIIDYWFVFIIWIAILAILVITYGKTHKTSKPNGFKGHLVYFANGLVPLLVLATLVVGGVRGGFKHSTRPITLSNAGQYVKEPKEVAIVLNTPFAIFRTMQKQSLQKVNYYATQEELEAVYNPVIMPDSTAKQQNLNVVILILESFGREYIGAYNQHLKADGYNGYTPFLDSLINESIAFRYGFSNGRKSIDAMPSVLASIPMMVEPFVLTSYSGNSVNSIASELGSLGYHTSFFHGAPNGSMGFQAFANVAGFKEYYGLNEYENTSDFDGMWGVWDEPFLQYYANKLNGFKQPFASALFTVSSHHPFRVPEQYEGKFPKGELAIHQCIGYTDYALKRFFETAKTMPWFENTLFVITADHANEPFYPEYKTNIGVFAVPIIFYKPGSTQKGMRMELAQQIDIMPTILGYLGYQKPFVAFGQNLLNRKDGDMAINYTASTYQLFMDDMVLLYNGKANGLYNYRSDSLLQQNLLNQYPNMEHAMEQKLKGIIQQYNQRMIDDKLRVE